MATTPSQKPVASELPQDLKFNSGKIDEFVTSLAMKYIDRLGGEHYTIEGIKQLAFEAMSNFGYVTISSFDGGATLTDPNQALLWESNGEYYKWTGNLPNTVPAGSTPDSTGGIGPGAWLSIGDSLLRSMLASSTGSQLIGTNHRGTLQADLDRMDNRTSGQTIANLQANTGDIVVDNTISGTTILPVANSHLGGANGGELVVTKGSNGINGQNKALSMHDMRIRGDGTVAYDDTVPTYSMILYGEDNVISGTEAKDATMGFYVRNQAKHTALIANRTENMTSHPNVGSPPVSSGGYGILTEGVENLLVLGHTAKGTNAADRHAVYLSEDASNLKQNKDVRIIGLRADYAGPSSDTRPERTSPMIFGRGNSNVIIDSSQLRGAGWGISFTDERQDYERISLSNLQVVDIKKNTSAECIGISFQSTGKAAGQFNYGFNVSNAQILMNPGVSGADRTNQYALQFVRSRFVNISNVTITSAGAAYAIRLVGCANVNLSNIVAWTNDGVSSSSAAALIQFSFSCSNVKISNLNYTGRDIVFAGLDDVSDMQVDWPRKARITVTSGVATVTADPWSLVSSVTVTSGSITVNWKGHLTQLAADAAIARPVSSNQMLISSTVGKTAGIVVYTMTGTVVNPSTGTYSFDVILFS